MLVTRGVLESSSVPKPLVLPWNDGNSVDSHPRALERLLREVGPGLLAAGCPGVIAIGQVEK